MDFSTDFSFKRLKLKDLNIQKLICNKKNTGLKQKNHEVTRIKIMIKPKKIFKVCCKERNIYTIPRTYCNCSVDDGYSYQNCDSNPNTQTKMDDWPGFLQYSGV
jgi:hypothetical protein